MSLLDSASLVVTPNGTKAGKLYSVVPSDGSGDLSVTRATTATRVNSSGLIESVASNVPRLDYSNGTCPSILVEPQRTNLLTYSSDFTNGWYAYLGSISATANYGIAPDGTTTSTRVLFTSTNQLWAKSISAINGNYGVFSIYIKGTAGKKIAITYGGVDNLLTLQSGWNRYEVKGTASIPFLFIGTFGADTLDIEVWAGQVELATYSTSYIPTTSASVTRNADVINKTGISSLIGQTEGTLFCEINTQISPANNWFQILDGTANNWIFIGLDANKLRGYIRLGATTVFSDTSFTLTSGVSAKIALAYKSGDIALYINGNQIATSSNSFTASSSIDRVIFGDLNNAPNDSAKYKQATLWKTRLTNTQLAQLTTI
jgi:hypothetical protein